MEKKSYRDSRSEKVERESDGERRVKKGKKSSRERKSNKE